MPRQFATSCAAGELTPRELEVLRLLAQGASSLDITRALFITLNTMRNHVQNLLLKLGAHTRLEAVAVARREGVTGLG